MCKNPVGDGAKRTRVIKSRRRNAGVQAGSRCCGFARRIRGLSIAIEVRLPRMWRLAPVTVSLYGQVDKSVKAHDRSDLTVRGEIPRSTGSRALAIGCQVFGSGNKRHETRPFRHETPNTDFLKLGSPRITALAPCPQFPGKKLLPIKFPRALRQLGHRLQDQSVVESRLAPGKVLRPADKARPGSIWDLFDREATHFSQVASPLECREAFATGCKEEVS